MQIHLAAALHIVNIVNIVNIVKSWVGLINFRLFTAHSVWKATMQPMRKLYFIAMEAYGEINNEVAEVAVACFHWPKEFLIPEMSFLNLFSTKITSAETRPINLRRVLLAISNRLTNQPTDKMLYKVA